MMIDDRVLKLRYFKQLCLAVVSFSYLYFPLAGNKSVYTPTSGINKEKQRTSKQVYRLCGGE